MSENHSEKSSSSRQDKSPWESMTETVNQARDFYRSIDIKGTVGKYREKINSDFFDNPTLKRIEHLPHKPKAIAAEIDRDLRVLSMQFNDAFPYVASMCRSHPNLILGSFLAVAILPIWSRAAKFKTVAKSAIAFALVGQGSLSLVNYQWRHDPSQPADPATAADASDK